MAEQTRGLTKRDILHIFFKHVRMITSVVLVAMLLTLIVLFVMPRQYEVESSILFKAPRMEMTSLYDTQNSNEKPFVNIAISEMINAEVPILQSPVLVRKVIREIGVDKVLNMGGSSKESWLSPVKSVVHGVVNGVFSVVRGIGSALGFVRPMTEEDKAYDRIQKNLEITKERNSNIIQVKLTCEDPVLGAKLVNALVAAYERRHAELYELTQDMGFFEKRVTQKKGELDAVEQKLREIREKYNMANPKSVYDAKLLAMGNLKQVLAADEARLSALEEREKSYRGLSNFKAGEFAKNEMLRSNPNLNEIMKSVLTAQEAFDQASSKYVKGSYPYESAKTEYAKMQDRFRSEVEDSLKGDKLEAMEVKGEIEKYRKAVSDLQTEVNLVQSQETEYERLLLEREIISNSYKSYSDREERARTAGILSTGQISNVAQIGEALPPIKPSSPRVGLVLLVAFILSLLASFGLILLFEYMNQTYRIDEDIEEQLGLRVVSSIPQL